MKKKVSLFVVFCMVLGLMVSGVAAQDNATISIDNVTAGAGDSVDVDVSISETSFAGFQFEIEYDSDALTPTGLTEVISGEVIANLEVGENLIQATFARATDIDFSGPIFTITFDVDGEAEVDAVGNISIDGDNDYNKVSAEDGTDLDVSYTAGSVTVVDPADEDLKAAEEAVNDLFDADGNLLEGITQADIDSAVALVAGLEDGEDKERLEGLLDDAQEQYDARLAAEVCDVCGELLDDCECVCDECGELLEDCECPKKDDKHAPTGSEMLPFLLIGGLLAVVGAVLVLPIRKLRRQ